jgi:hypothetical protein
MGTEVVMICICLEVLGKSMNSFGYDVWAGWKKQETCTIESPFSVLRYKLSGI